MSEQNPCAYELCKRSDPIEVVPGHRAKQYHDENCRQAQHRLRKDRDEREKKTNLDHYLTRYHSQRLHTILERMLKEQGANDLLRLVTAIDEECGYAQASDEMQKRVVHLEEITEQQLIKDLQAVCVNAADPALLNTPYGQALLLVKEREQEVTHLKTRIEKQYERKLTKQQLYIQDLEAGQAEWTAWKEAETRGCGDLVAMRQYLQDHELDAIPIQRNGITVKVIALGEDAIAVTEDHGLLRLNDEELQQGRVWVCKRKGVPVIATWLPIGETAAEGKHRLQVEQKLEEAQCEIQALQLELAKYLPAPRVLLECSLRLWGTRIELFHIDDLEVFLREASDRRLLKEIGWARDCYFIGRQHQRRIGIVAEAITRRDKLFYNGDKDQVFTSLDQNGYATFASKGRKWLDVDAVRQLWALVVAEGGQCHVGSNVEVAQLQQYLYDHLGSTIPVQQGTKTYQLIMVDDDGLAITMCHYPHKLYEDGLEQAHAWIKHNRDVQNA